MNYLKTLTPLAEAALRPLAEKTGKLVRELEALNRRVEGERGSAESLETHLAKLKAAAGEYLSQNEYASFKVKLKRVTADLTAAREAVTLFEHDLIPAKARELDGARLALSAAAGKFYREHLPGCETEMAEALAVAVAAHDDFLAAFAELGAVYGCGFPRTLPVVRHARLDSVARRNTGSPWLTFAAAPPATSPGAAIPVAPARTETPPTVAQAPGVKELAPAPPEAALDAPDAPPPIEGVCHD
jgi:hypothetical protein